MKILVMGLPGSGKTTFSEKMFNVLNQVFPVTWYNADRVRHQFDDWDFSKEGRVRQAKRMNKLANDKCNSNNLNIVIVDFIAPTAHTRSQFDADYVIWMNTIDNGRFEDTNSMFTEPRAGDVDTVITTWKYDMKTIDRICNDIVTRKYLKSNKY